MSYTLQVRVEAEEDVLQACEWYDSRQEGLGDRLLDAVEAVFDQIGTHPIQWAEGFRGIRRVRVPRFPYVVHYVVENEIVEAIAVMHGRQHARSWQSRLK